MKKLILILYGLLVFGFLWSCEPEPNEGEPIGQPLPVPTEPIPVPTEPIPVPQEPSVPTDTPQNSLSYPWRMVVQSVDNYEGGEYNVSFKDVLLGNTLPNGISTSNTTFFKLDSTSNKMEIKLTQGLDGWTIWEAYGFYPIIWEFTYEKTPDSLKFEGLANIWLSECDIPEGSNMVNRFYFGGSADKTRTDKYVGRYVWSETYETGTCIKIEGEMEVIRSMSSYPVY